MKRAKGHAVAVVALVVAACSRPSRLGEVAPNDEAKSGASSEAPKPVASQSQQPARSKVAGTPFALSVPPGFVPATQFDGFIAPDEATSIMISGLPVPRDELSEMWRPEKLQSQGMSLVKKEPVAVAGIDAELAFVTQRISGVDVEKWILVFPTAEQTFLCVAAYPATLASKARAPLRESLLSMSYDAAAAVAAASTFEIEVTGLKLAHRISKAEVYTADGKAQKSAPGAPVLVVGPSVARVEPSDRMAYAEQRLRQMAHITIVEVAAPTALSVDALSGYELVATGTDTASDKPMTAYQVMLFADDHYFIVQGLVGRDQAAVYLPQFKQAARSFRRKRPRH